MTSYEQLCITKLFFIAMGIMGQSTISPSEMDVACEALKRIADQRYDWSEQQRNTYKWLVDYANNLNKHK